MVVVLIVALMVRIVHYDGFNADCSVHDEYAGCSVHDEYAGCSVHDDFADCSVDGENCTL
jgi:hypothetical protein